MNRSGNLAITPALGAWNEAMSGVRFSTIPFVLHHCVGIRLVLLGGAAQPFGRILPAASTAAWSAKLAE